MSFVFYSLGKKYLESIICLRIFCSGDPGVLLIIFYDNWEECWTKSCCACLPAEVEDLRQKAALQRGTQQRLEELECINAGLRRELQEKVAN